MRKQWTWDSVSLAARLYYLLIVMGFCSGKSGFCPLKLTPDIGRFSHPFLNLAWLFLWDLTITLREKLYFQGMSKPRQRRSRRALSAWDFCKRMYLPSTLSLFEHAPSLLWDKEKAIFRCAESVLSCMGIFVQFGFGPLILLSLSLSSSILMMGNHSTHLLLSVV